MCVYLRRKIAANSLMHDSQPCHNFFARFFAAELTQPNINDSKMFQGRMRTWRKWQTCSIYVKPRSKDKLFNEHTLTMNTELELWQIVFIWRSFWCAKLYSNIVWVCISTWNRVMMRLCGAYSFFGVENCCTCRNSTFERWIFVR